MKKIKTKNSKKGISKIIFRESDKIINAYKLIDVAKRDNITYGGALKRNVKSEYIKIVYRYGNKRQKLQVLYLDKEMSEKIKDLI